VELVTGSAATPTSLPKLALSSGPPEAAIIASAVHFDLAWAKLVLQMAAESFARDLAVPPATCAALVKAFVALLDAHVYDMDDHAYNGAHFADTCCDALYYLSKLCADGGAVLHRAGALPLLRAALAAHPNGAAAVRCRAMLQVPACIPAVMAAAIAAANAAMASLLAEEEAEHAGKTAQASKQRKKKKSKKKRSGGRAHASRACACAGRPSRKLLQAATRRAAGARRERGRGKGARVRVRRKRSRSRKGKFKAPLSKVDARPPIRQASRAPLQQLAGARLRKYPFFHWRNPPEDPPNRKRWRAEPARPKP
jgi:hypothetical protein